MTTDNHKILVVHVFPCCLWITQVIIDNSSAIGFVWVEVLRPSQQFFSHVETEPPLPVYYQYFLGGKCILLKDTTR